MALAGNQPEQNQHLKTFSSHRYYVDANTQNNIQYKTNRDVVLDLTNDSSLKPVFMTDSSSSSSSSSSSISSTNRGNIKTTTFRETTNEHNSDLAECPICCDSIPSNELKQMPCCGTRLCSSCLITHTITNIRNGKAKIECPACSQDINSSTILYNSELPVSIRERYQEILAQNLADTQDAYIKLCPHCNFITILDENDPKINRKKARRGSSEWITCDQCHKEWCWSCYAPAHPDETCKQFKKTHTQLETWAKTRRADNQQRNAQRCPKCSIFIEKIDGCDHMVCSKCSSKFCYRCGSRMRLPFYIGHDAKYSIFGCKYKLWPDRPFLRWLVRGSIFTGILILSPVVLAAAIALLAIGIPVVLVIGCFALPIYACVQCKKRS